MRPRHYTAENGKRRRSEKPGPQGFNEAAALHRGKRFDWVGIDEAHK